MAISFTYVNIQSQIEEYDTIFYIQYFNISGGPFTNMVQLLLGHG